MIGVIHYRFRTLYQLTVLRLELHSLFAIFNTMTFEPIFLVLNVGDLTQDFDPGSACYARVKLLPVFAHAFLYELMEVQGKAVLIVSVYRL